MKVKTKTNRKKRENGIKKNNLFLVAMIILLIGVTGAGAIGYVMLNSNPVDNNKTPSNINNNTNNTRILNNGTNPKDGYALITISRLKCYVKAEYINFIHVTDDTDYDGLDGYYELTKEKSVDFVDYSDFAQFYTRDGNFRIEVYKSLEPKDLNYYNENNDNNSTNDNKIENNDNNSNDKIDTSKNITVNGNKVNIIHIKNYSDQTVTNEEFTFVYFKVKNKDVKLGWAGNTIDMYVIESFFKLN